MKTRIGIWLLLSLIFSTAQAASPLPAVTVYKSPSCGCCEKWVAHMQASGFKVVVHDTENLAQHKARLGVPPAMGSCHTAEVGGYVVEGHVPASDVKRLLSEKKSVRGLVAPGMPASAPGMDVPGRIPYAVYTVKNDGTTVIYARH